MWHKIRYAVDMSITRLLSIDTNAKTKKGQKRGYMTGIMYLAPSDQSGVINVCAHASVGCRAACLFSAGMGKFPSVIKGRTRKTVWFKEDRQTFLAQLEKDIAILERKAREAGMVPAVRLNGTSDIPWENFGIFDKFPQIQFYDYTKHVARMLPTSRAQKTPNYHLTFSRSESNENNCKIVASLKRNIAVVFSDANYPPTYYGLPVINGDADDLRFLDKKGCVVGLYAKGKAKIDGSGFVVSTIA